MKFYSLSVLFALVAVLTVTAAAQDEAAGGAADEEPPEAVVVSNHNNDNNNIDCDTICHERHEALMREKDELGQSREALRREKEELMHSHEAMIREKDELWHSREAILRERDELVVQQNERAVRDAGNVDELRKSLEEKESELALKTKEMEHYQKVARDNQKYMQEYKDQLATQRDRSHKLNIALTEARTKIEELENTTFFAKLRNELATGWGTVVQYWNELKAKCEKEL